MLLERKIRLIDSPSKTFLMYIEFVVEREINYNNVLLLITTKYLNNSLI